MLKVLGSAAQFEQEVMVDAGGKEFRGEGVSRPCLVALSLYQSLGGEHSCSESNGGRMGQIHALQFVSGGVQMRFHGAKSQPVDGGNLLIGFAPRRPK
jgi:hypothetical protein